MCCTNLFLLVAVLSRQLEGSSTSSLSGNITQILVLGCRHSLGSLGWGSEIPNAGINVTVCAGGVWFCLVWKGGFLTFLQTN